MQGQGDLNQPVVVTCGENRSRGEKDPVNRIKGTLKYMAIKRNRTGTDIRIPPGNNPPGKTPGDKNLLGIKDEGDIVVKKFLPPE